MTNPTKHNESSITSRQAALKILLAVLKEGQSLSSLTHLTENMDARDAAFARMLSFGVLRFYHALLAGLKPFIKKPLKVKDLDIQLVILIALYQIRHTRVPRFAAVDVAVKQTKKSKKKWAANMVNGVLRNFLRQYDDLSDNQKSNESQTPVSLCEEAQFAHPQWMIDRLKADWPEQWQAILEANNQQAPMTLRINLQRTHVADFKGVLDTDYALSSDSIAGIEAALVLDQARDVKQLPGFSQGWFSVQDAGAQIAAHLLQPCQGERILDACSAPGGKTAHLFELQPDIDVSALDISAERLKRVKENAVRLGFEPRIIAADACDPESWWQGQLFDKILLDVPCSAVGVIRRHPDIKHLRWAHDIDALVALQRDILLKNWALLKPGGMLLYATCSLFKAENEDQMTWFQTQVDDLQWVDMRPRLSTIQTTLFASPMSENALGVQLLPVSGEADGFYYALIQKTMA